MLAPTDAHEGKHVRQNHDPCPQAAHWSFHPKASRKLNDARYGEVGVVTIRGCTPFTEIRFAKGRQGIVEGAPSAKLAVGDTTYGDNAKCEQNAL